MTKAQQLLQGLQAAGNEGQQLSAAIEMCQVRRLTKNILLLLQGLDTVLYAIVDKDRYVSNRQHWAPEGSRLFFYYCRIIGCLFYLCYCSLVYLSSCRQSVLPFFLTILYNHCRKIFVHAFIIIFFHYLYFVLWNMTWVLVCNSVIGDGKWRHLGRLPSEASSPRSHNTITNGTQLWYHEPRLPSPDVHDGSTPEIFSSRRWCDTCFLTKSMFCFSFVWFPTV